MRIQARFFTLTADLCSAIDQVEERVGKELMNRAAALPELQKVGELVLFLAVTTDGKYSLGRSYPNGKCIVSYQTRYKSWFGSTWQQRVELVADAYEMTVRGVPKTRIIETERASLLQLLAEVRRDALNRPPDELAETVSTVFRYMPDGYDPEAPKPPPNMVKLYKRVGGNLHYREVWIEPEHHTVTQHEGVCGTRGSEKRQGGENQSGARALLDRFVATAKHDGFNIVPQSRMKWLIVEYAVGETGMGTPEDLDRRGRIEKIVDEELGWCGLGHCDGGSIGSGTMEIACLVVDYTLAKAAIEKVLVESEFRDVHRIYQQR
jgi:hypothetical protein